MTANPFDQDHAAAGRQRLWGAAVLIAIAVIVLPLLLDGAGSESKFRRVEKLREEPPIVLDRLGNSTTLRIPENSPLDVLGTGERSAGNDGSEIEAPDAQLPGVGVEEDRGLIDTIAESVTGNRPADQATNEVADRSDLLEQAGAEEEAKAAAAANAAAAAALAAAAAASDPQTREPLVQNSAENPLTAWVVQAGIYELETDALAIRDRLRQAGFASFVRDRDNLEDPFRVLVGPMIKEQSALDSLKSVVELLGSNAIVTSYP